MPYNNAVARVLLLGMAGAGAYIALRGFLVREWGVVGLGLFLAAVFVSIVIFNRDEGEDGSTPPTGTRWRRPHPVAFWGLVGVVAVLIVAISLAV
jgi:multisubunit Na+/H+ antiporter MnhB subunit